jgi:DNA-binding MarR family transcriptional regulator
MIEQLKLENQLCFRLYNLNKVVNRLYTPLLKKLGLTYPQYLVMLVLWQAKKAVSVKDIGDKLNLDSGTLSPLLKRMEKQSLITRVRSEQDERVVEIELTAHGKELKNGAKNIPGSLACQIGLSPKDASSINQCLDQLLEKLNTDLNTDN